MSEGALTIEGESPAHLAGRSEVVTMNDSSSPRSSRKRWVPLAVVAPTVLITAAVAVPLSAGAAPSLPEKSAADILASIADSSDAVFSGSVTQTSSLGLPEIPSSASGDSGREGMSDALDLLTGSHDLRVFVGGTETSRVQILDTFAERNVIRNGDDVWTYDSKSNEATHVTLTDSAEADSADAATPPTPVDVANRILSAAEQTSDIAVDDNARVAGRSAYRVTITPKTDATLVGSATIAVDAETGLPLSVEIDARGQSDPAFAVAFTSIDLSAPDAGLFDFTPPAGAAVDEIDPSKHHEHDSAQADEPDLAAPTTTGEGWATITEIPAAQWAAQLEASGRPSGASDGPSDSSNAAGILDQLTTPVTGGRAVQTALASVLLTDDGRVLVGAVPVDALVIAASE